MKNLIVNIFKTLFFFDLLLIVIALIPDIKTENTNLVMLLNEGSAFLAVGIFTLFFLKRVEKKKLKLSEKKGKLKPMILGVLLGAAIPVIFSVVMRIYKYYNFDGFNKIPHIWYYIGAIFLNALWNELLIRGYLFSLYKKHYGFIFATIATTLLFVSMNHEILKMNKIYLAVVILLNIFFCFIRDGLKTPVATVFARFSYLFISGFIFGSNLFSEEYPALGKYTFEGKNEITGGEYLVEGSMVTLITLSVIILVWLTVKYKLWQYFTKEKIGFYIGWIKQFVADFVYRVKGIFYNISYRTKRMFRIIRRHR